MSTDRLLEEFIKYREDPWYFITHCVYTLDQVDAEQPIKQFPFHRDYLKLFVKLWHKYPHLAVPKSRRMTMSWTCIALFLWDSMFHRGKFNAFVSKKEEDAGELIERAQFIYDHIPEDKIPKSLLPKLRTKAKPPMLIFDELNSKIQGFPMGANQLRQFTFSGIFGDETAFWPDALQFYSSSRPTLDGGGRMTLVSSAAPGFFKNLCFDTLNREVDLDEVPEGGQLKEPMQGIRLWKNPENKFLVSEIHYTADPAKRDPEFKNTLMRVLPKKEYLREYEINWDSFSGHPVYDDFQRGYHTTNEILQPRLGLPLLLGWDFGLTPAAIVAQLQEDQLVILREYVAKGKSIDIFAPEVMGQLRVLYPEWQDAHNDFRHYIDPAGTHRDQTDSNTCKKEMHNQGLRNIYLGKQDWESRRMSVEHFLLKRSKQGPGFLMNPQVCPVLTRGFQGGYMYPDSVEEVEPMKLRPVKNAYSHPHDALQYLCTRVRIMQNQQTVEIPTNKYSFQTTKADTQGRNEREINTWLRRRELIGR